MRKLSMLLLLSVFLSCSTNETQTLDLENLASKNERMYFKNWEDFGEKYQDLSKLNEENSNKTQSDFSEDESSTDLSPSLNKMLNKNKEFQVLDEIIWYKNGVFYSINIKNQDKVNSLKTDFLNLPVCEKITISPVKILNQEKNDTNNSRTLIGTNGSINAIYQLEFNRTNYYDCVSAIDQGPVSAKVKYVHELYTERISTGGAYACYLYLRLKLEWRNNSGKWNFAGEKRNIDVNITDDSKLVSTTGFLVENNYAPYGATNIVRSFSCSQNQTILLRYNTVLVPLSQWSASVTGTITHRINGDNPANVYYNTVNW